MTGRQQVDALRCPSWCTVTHNGGVGVFRLLDQIHTAELGSVKRKNSRATIEISGGTDHVSMWVHSYAIPAMEASHIQVETGADARKIATMFAALGMRRLADAARRGAELLDQFHAEAVVK